MQQNPKTSRAAPHVSADMPAACFARSVEVNMSPILSIESGCGGAVELLGEGGGLAGLGLVVVAGG